MPKVLISDSLSPRAVDIFRQRGVEVDVKPGLDADALAAIIGEYDGLAVRSATKATGALIDAAGRLKVIGRAGIGVDNIDVAAATAKGVVVMNTPFGNSITTAEHAVAMMFAVARQIPQANASTHAGKWEKSKFMGVELYGKTLGVIGCGNIGAIVADRAIGLKMKVIAYDPFLSAERAIDLGVEKVELDTLLARADIITLHTPLTDATRGIVGREAFARMKKGVLLVNCARGGLVDEAALKDALDDGTVAGAALDVFAQEPAKENPLFGHPNVVCTPHLGASTGEAQENVALQVAEQMSDFLINGAVTNALNMASVTAEEAPRLRPYLRLADLLGGFAGQITEHGIRAVSVEYEGDVAALNTRPITAVLLTGLLRPLLDSVNMVSAPVIARERDIDVSETKRDQCRDYHTLIRLTVTTDKRTRAVGGSLFGGDKPRVVDLEDTPLEAELSRHMLFVRNQDKPGLIGGLGTLLGDAGINIANFHLGRRAEGEDAIALVSVDQPVPGAVIDAVAGLPSVVQVKALAF
ncbi:MAG: phosphoglycerate dehydrogenase [Inquilinaceae bacterium]